MVRVLMVGNPFHLLFLTLKANLGSRPSLLCFQVPFRVIRLIPLEILVVAYFFLWFLRTVPRTFLSIRARGEIPCFRVEPRKTLIWSGFGTFSVTIIRVGLIRVCRIVLFVLPARRFIIRSWNTRGQNKFRRYCWLIILKIP